MRQMTQKEFAKLTMRAAMEKIQIQDKLNKGETVVALAAHYGVSRHTMTDVLETLDVKYTREDRKQYAQSDLMNNALTVLARVAKSLDVDYTEIKPYLVNENDK